VTEPDPRQTEIDRLHRENLLLNEQVKLLVQTEQRLYQSRTALDRELARIGALGRFALACSTLESEAPILDQATALLHELFDVDEVAVREGDPWPVGTDEQVVVALPLPPREGTPRALVAGKSSGSRASFHRETLGPMHETFLRLLENHLNGALQNAALKSELREHSQRLAEANRRLQESIDHLERTQRRLAEAQKMEAVGRLAGGVAHDFNNLLTVILGHADLLLGLVGDDDPHGFHARRIADAARRAAAVTSQLLAFSRRQPRNPRLVDLGHTVRGTASMVDRLLGERVHLDLRVDDALPTIRLDRGHADQILMNLFLNARDAMIEGGKVTVIVRRATCSDARVVQWEGDAAGAVALIVRDEGEGMDKETAAQIFEPFFTTKEMGRGTGLGLSTVYGLVLQNDGRIGVRTEPGHGSEFVIVFPTTVGTPESARPEVPAASPPTSATGKTVLLAEDEPAIRDLARTLLEGLGCETLCAGDGQEALAMSRCYPDAIDLVVTDVVMPRLNGPELVDALKRERSPLPVLYMTGHSREWLPDAEDPPVLLKPFTPDQFLDRIRGILHASGS